MLRSSAGRVLALSVAQVFASPPIAQAAEKPAIAGTYMCSKGCRNTDALLASTSSATGPIA